MRSLTFRHYVITACLVFICYQLHRIAAMATRAAEIQSDILPWMIPLLLMIPLTRWTTKGFERIVAIYKNRDIPEASKDDLSSRKEKP